MTTDRPGKFWFDAPRWVRHVCAGILVGIMAIVLLEHVRELDVRVDESAWITSGYITYGLVTDLAPPSRWEDAYGDLGTWGNMNPTVGKFLIGLFTAMVVRPGDSVAYKWEWGKTLEENRLTGRLPPPHVLYGVRRGMVVLGICCLLLTYLIALQLVGDRWIAIWAPVALFLNPAFRAQSATVFTDVAQLLFLLLSCWLFNRFLARGSWYWFVAAGAALGLACAVKFNSAPFLLAACLFAWPDWTETRRRLIAALGTVLLVFATFVAANPYLYPDPLRRMRDITGQWSQEIAEQQRDPQLVKEAVTSRGEATRLVWTRAIAGQGVASVLLLVAGLVGIWRSGAERLASPAVFIGMVFVAFVIGISLWLPFIWPRYYLPVSVWIPMIQVVGLATIGSAFRKVQLRGVRS